MKKKRIGGSYDTPCFTKLSLKMRITFILLITVMFQMHATVHSQKSILTLDLENKPMGEVFERIEKQSGFNFLYNNNHIDLERKVSVVATKQRIEKILYGLFRNTNIEFVILDRQIILKLKKAKEENGDSLPKIDVKEDNVQQKITGTVVDNDGFPLLGVSVLVKGTQRGVSTDFDGNFSIDAALGEVLVFSYIGFLNAEILIEPEITQYLVDMTPTSFELEGVELVSTGYQSLPEERASGSFGKVDNDLFSRKNVGNIADQLNGEVAGVQFNPASTGPPIIIRGVSTINANQNPLIVLDGFPIEGDLSTIDPNTVESITVLKDAAAASIWGLRAANGVIVIVTKKGNENSKPKIEFTFNTYISSKPNLKKNKLASSSTQIDYATSFYDNGLSLRSDVFSVDDGSIGGANTAQLSPLDRILSARKNGLISEAQEQEQINALRNIDIRDEYSRLLLRPKVRKQYGVTASGGGEHGNYRMSLLYNGEEGNFKGEQSDELNLNLDNSIDLTDRLRLKTNINTTIGRSKLIPDEYFLSETSASFIQGFRPIFPEDFIRNYPLTGSILNEDGSYAAMVGGASPEASSFMVDNGFLPYTYNLMQDFDNNNNSDKTLSARIQTALTYDITNDFSVEARYQYESASYRNENIINENSYINRSIINNFTQFDQSDFDDIQILEQPVPRGSMAFFSDNNTTSHTFRTQLNFDKSLNDDLHQINALAGYEVRKTLFEQRQSVRYGYNEQALTYINPDYTRVFDEQIADDSDFISDLSEIEFIENRFISTFANLSYTYDQKYTLTGSTRLDDTNLFGQTDEFRNIPLYSVGLKWNLDREAFMNSEHINNLDLRVTYGTNGNVNLDTSPLLKAGLSNSSSRNYPNVPFAFIGTVPNPTLRLERTRAINVGIDFGLFNNAISGSFEYYIKNSEDLFVDQLLNPTSGIESSKLNIGELKNEGVDLSLTLDPFKSNAFSYKTRFNFSYNANRVTALNIDPGTNLVGLLDGTQALLNQPLFTLHSYKYANLDNRGYAQFLNENNDIVNYQTRIQDPNALKIEGTIIAPYYGSWVNDFKYKGWSLRTLASFQAGHVFRFGDVYNPGEESSEATFQDFEQRWQQSGDENTTDVPALITDFDDKFAPAYSIELFAATGEEIGQYTFSDKFVDTATNIVLQEVILSYSLNELAMNQLGMNNLTLSVQGNNLHVWNFNKWNVDPNNSFIPLIPTYSFSIRASF